LDTQDIYLIDEWYGYKRGPQGRITGLQMPVEAVAEQIRSQEKGNLSLGNYAAPWYGVADPSMWSRTSDVMTFGQRINQDGPLFRAGNRDRALRKQVYHSLLRVNPDTGHPKFRVCQSCKHFRRIFPQLVLDEANLEDVESKKQEDHIYDGNGYGLVELTEAPAQKADAKMKNILRRAARRPVLI